MFYVSIIDGKRLALAAGPFPTHEEALNLVEPVRRLAARLFPNDSVWWSFGTCKLKEPAHGGYPEGKLNKELLGR